jgi:outer membrane autotransporter protein
VTNTDATVLGSNGLGRFFVDSATHSTLNVLLENGGLMDVLNSGLATGTTINSGGTQNVSSGGSAVEAWVNSGGKQNVSSGGHASATHIQKDGEERLSGGDSLSAIIDGRQTVLTGGTATFATINSGGTQNVSSGGSAVDTRVNAGGSQNIFSSGTATSAIISAHGEQNIGTGGSAVETVVEQDGVQNVSSGGTALSTTVKSGGSQNVSSGGSAVEAWVNSGGKQNVSSGGHASATHIQKDGEERLSGGDSLSAIIDGRQTVLTGGTATFATINSGGTQNVSSGGSAVETVVEQDGVQNVSSGGSASSTTVTSSGRLVVEAGGRATGVNQSSGGALVTNTDATVLGSNGLGRFFLDSATHSTLNVLLENGGLMDVGAGANARDTRIQNGGELKVSRGGRLSGTTTVTDGGQVSGDIINDGTLRFSLSSSSEQRDAHITGSGSVVKDGQGALVLSGGVMSQPNLYLNGGSVSLNDMTVSANVTAQDGTALYLGGDTALTGWIDPTDVTLGTRAVWNMTDNSVVDTLNNGGHIYFPAPPPAGGHFTPHSLTVHDWNGNGGTVAMGVEANGTAFHADRLIVDGGQTSGETALSFSNYGGLGAPTTGNGISVVEVKGGATVGGSAFSQSGTLAAGAYQYRLHQGADGGMYLTTESGSGGSQNYRPEMSLYSSLYAQAMNYDRSVMGSRDTRRTRAYEGEHNTWGRIEGEHQRHQHDGNTPDSSTSVAFAQVGGDIWQHTSEAAEWSGGLYGAAGLSVSDVSREKTKMGVSHDKAYSYGMYFSGTGKYGWWGDAVVQLTRHALDSRSVNGNSMNTRGWGYVASLESGRSFSVTESVTVEPQIQYLYSEVELDRGHDEQSEVKYGRGENQQVRVGVKAEHRSVVSVKRQGILTDMPLSLWVRPSVVQTYGSGKMDVAAPGVEGSEVSFRPGQEGTSVRVDVGMKGDVRENVTLGAGMSYTQTTKGAGTGGYGGQVNLKVTF